MRKPTWKSRFRSHRWTCLGHIAQGVAGAALYHFVGEIAALICFAGFAGYQWLSFERKVNDTGRGDTAGYDTYDWIVGFAPAVTLIWLLTKVIP